MAELELSRLVCDFEHPEELICRDEAEYSGKVDYLAKYVIEHSSVRVMLLSGPSGSGKTTTANLLRDRVVALGKRSLVISLDDYYRNSDDESYPRLCDGSKDYESPYALDIDKLRATLKDIAEGKPFSVPKYDFKVGARVGERLYDGYSDACVIIEGIHALNPILSEALPQDRVLKVFVSVSTNINRDGIRILSGRKIRFLRRLVRDSIYRNASAEKTLSMWENVLRGEDKYLYPYKDLANIHFDTFHTFEVGVLGGFATELLSSQGVAESELVSTVRSALALIPTICPTLVPESSLIKEFIPGGIYENLY